MIPIDVLIDELFELRPEGQLCSDHNGEPEYRCKLCKEPFGCRIYLRSRNSGIRVHLRHSHPFELEVVEASYVPV